MANIFVYLEDLGVNFNAKTKKDSVSTKIKEVRGVFDESLAYKMVDELEEWKQSQIEAFMKELKEKETNYLEQLKYDWEKKRAKQEEELVLMQEKYSKLVGALEEVHKSMDDKSEEFLTHEQKSQRLRHELEKTYNEQLLSFRDRVRGLESEFEHKLRLEDLKNRELEAAKRHLEKENCELRRNLEHLKIEVQDLQSNVIPKQHLNDLLSDMVSCIDF